MTKILNTASHRRTIINLLCSAAMGILTAIAFAKLMLPIKVLTPLFIGVSLPLSVVYTLLFYFLVFKFLPAKWENYPLKVRLAWVGLCALWGGLFVFILPVRLPKTLESAPTYIHFLIWLGLSFCFSVLLLVLSAYLVTRPVVTTSHLKEHRWTWLIYAGFLMFVWILYLLAYYPGGMSPDSLNQWEQIVTGEYRDWHPIFHTLTMWLITRVWYSPAAVAIVQIIALALVMGWGFSILQEMQVNQWVIYGLVLFSALTPGNGMMVITLWKDVFFSIAVLALTLILLKTVNTNGAWLEKAAGFLFLGLICAFVLLYRHNGYLVIPFVILLLLVFYRSFWKQITLSFLFCMVLFGLVKYPLYSRLNVTDYRVPSTIAALNVIAAQFDNKTPMTEGDRAYLNNILPLLPREKAWPYNCYSNDELFLTDRLNFNFILDHQLDIWKLAGKLTLLSPRPTIDYFICNSTFMFNIFAPPRTPYEFVVNYISPNIYGLETSPKIPFIKVIIDRVITYKPLLWIIGRAALWFYISIFAVSVFALRYKSPLHFLVLVPSVMASVPMAFLGGGQIFRYVYSSYLVGILLFGLLFVEKPATRTSPPDE